MLWRLLGFLLFVGGVFFIALVFKGDPCEQEGWAFGLTLGAVMFGAMAFLLVGALTSRMWVRWGVAVTTTAATGVFVWFMAVLDWVSECAN